MEPTRPFVAQAGISALQSAIYVAAVVLLLVGAAVTLVGTVVDVIEGADSRRITDTGIFILDRVLLLFIIGELLYTLRLVEAGGRIIVEPFLLIGLIAVVRRVLVIIEVESREGDVTDLVIEVGALSGLMLVLTVSIFLLRRSRPTAAGDA